MPNLKVADLHSHFPMQLWAPERRKGPEESWLAITVDNLVDVVHAGVLSLARRMLNDRTPHSGPAVSIARYRQGRVALAFSVLYSPLDELSLAGLKQKPPSPEAFDALMHQLINVEIEVGRHFDDALVVRSAADLARAQAGGKLAVVHCIEGGFHLGESVDAILRNVALLKHHGVAYVTLAHLLYRGVATNMAAFPQLPDHVFHKWHPQPDSGLTALGLAAVRALLDHRILVDVTHMSRTAMQETFALLDALDPGRTMPVIASHMACRFGALEYNMEDEWLLRIHERRGVIGIILCEHYMQDGLEASPRTAEHSFAVIRQHIDRIRSVTGSYDAIAIGSDHDGFIRPTLHGFEDPRRLADLADRLEAAYGTDAATQICLGNVQRVLSAVF